MKEFLKKNGIRIGVIVIAVEGDVTVNGVEVVIP